MTKKDLRTGILAALFAATVFLTTRFLQIPVLTNGGYIHLGDAVIMLCAAVLPRKFAIFSSSVGAGIADLTVSPAWAPWTIIIKALVACCFCSSGNKIVTKRNIIAAVPAAIITMGGYYIAEGLLFGNWITPLASIGGNAAQAVGSAVVFILLGAALDKTSFKNKITTL